MRGHRDTTHQGYNLEWRDNLWSQYTNLISLMIPGRNHPKGETIVPPIDQG